MRRLLYNCRIVNGNSAPVENGWILIENHLIADVGTGSPEKYLPQPGIELTDCHGAMAMPGMIDCHVHFREPGMTRKATIASESAAAVAGGVTSYLEMPNTSPSTVNRALWQEKMDIAARDSRANYAFFIGATDDNLEELKSMDYSRVPGIKLFVGSSTGKLLVSDREALEKLFAEAPAIIAVHSEDDATLIAEKKAFLRKNPSPRPEDHIEMRSRRACMKSTELLLGLARRHGTRLHICHLTTADELAFFSPESRQPGVTCEVAPAHLLWCREDYRRLGNLIKINPSVKEVSDRDALRQGVVDGSIDMIATDHAPHLWEEKSSTDVLKAVSGAPVVQFALPMLLEFFPSEVVAEKYSRRPAEIYNIEGRGSIAKGFYADIVLVADAKSFVPASIGHEDLFKPIDKSEVLSLCGWTPLEGCRPAHRVIATFVNGSPAFSLLPSLKPSDTASAMPLKFNN